LTGEQQMTAQVTANMMVQLARAVRLLLLDVDGVLSDGRIFLSGGDLELIAFDTQDGVGIRAAQAVGLKIGIITGRRSPAVQQRARQLDIEIVYLGSADKVQAFKEILQHYDLQPAQVAYVGDDWQDIPLMRMVGLPLAVANARTEVKAVACHVSENTGGRGAVRELIEWLLDLQGLKETAFRTWAGHH
jgi:3-deoxy-D-manno-octulosonate 8-phosphate phosphatase (KDO 8-P phosphatase)